MSIETEETGVPEASRDESGMTRRDLFRTALRGAATLPFLAGSHLAAQQGPGKPQNVRLLDSYGGEYSTGRAVLRPNDLRFLGFYRFPSNMDTLAGIAFPTMTFRKVGGQSRVFVWGGPRKDFTDYGLMEIALPDTPSTTVATAPQGTLIRDWGNLTKGYANADGTGGIFPTGMLYDETRNAIWWTYCAVYVAAAEFPALGCSVLNDSNGTFQSYGPWRTQWRTNMTLGPLGMIPAAFAAQYTNGKRLGMVGAQVSGNAASPFGASLSAHEFIDHTRAAANAFNDGGGYSLASHGLIQHPVEHKQARDTNYKLCMFVRGGADPYVCTPNGSYGGSTVQPGAPVFGSQEGAVGTNDGMSSWVWIDLPDKHGLLYFGQLATTPTGYVAPYDADGLIHRGYASLSGQPPVCCHGQDDPFFNSTGPWAHAMMPMGWIYNPDDLVATARGTASLWSRTPTSVFQWKDYSPQFQSPLDTRNIGRFPSGMFGGGAHFDPSTRRLYTTLRFMDQTSIFGFARPVICVWEVA